MAFVLPTTKYIAFIDETGDHNMERINPKYPVFAICAHTTRVDSYTLTSLPNLIKLKQDLFGSEEIVIHGHKIRQKKPPFDGLQAPDKFANFTKQMGECFRAMDGHLIAAAIDKPKLKEKYTDPANPFFLSMQFVLERLHLHWWQLPLHCVIEARGGKPDDQTELWFNDICSGNNYSKQKFNFTYEFQPKSANIAGHQYVDLAAYTIARFTETRDENRQDWKIIKDKIRKSWLGDIYGYGLKIFPKDDDDFPKSPPQVQQA